MWTVALLPIASASGHKAVVVYPVSLCSACIWRNCNHLSLGVELDTSLAIERNLSLETAYTLSGGLLQEALNSLTFVAGPVKHG